MDARTARLLQELSNFYCHPGKAGGTPLVIRVLSPLRCFVVPQSQCRATGDLVGRIQ